MSENDRTRPLQGIRVLDITNFLSGPYCTQVLADLGAEVIKVESPSGDSSRSIPPFFVGEDSAYYLANNRNKASIVVDLKTAEGLVVVRDLIRHVDVVVENFRPGVLAKLGLDHARIREEHPSLIWSSISGFGQTGPWRDRPAYDMIVQALSGAMSITGEPGRAAARVGPPIGDLAASLFACIGILASLVGRDARGEGRTIDVSMLDAQLSLLSYQAVYSMIGGYVPGRQGARHDSIPTYRSFLAGDGREFVVTANTERMWRSLCEVIGLSELPEEPLFETGADRLENREALWEILEAAFLTKDAETWVESLMAVGVPAALIKAIDEALADADESGRGMILDVHAPDGRPVRVMATPIHFTGAADAIHRYPPGLGEQTRTVLTEVLGLTDDEVTELVRKGAVAEQSIPATTIA